MKTFKQFTEAKKVKKGKDDPCWKGYVQLGTKKGKDGKEVPNCVPVEEESTELQERSPIEDLKVMFNKKFNKNYEKALKWMKSTGKTGADAERMFRGTDARELDKMYAALKEEVAANSVAGGGVDMNPTGYAKRDKRKKGDTERMYRRAQGMSFIEKLIKSRKK